MNKIKVIVLFIFLALNINAQSVWLNSIQYKIKTGNIWQKDYSTCNVDICITQYENIQNKITIYDNNENGHILTGWNINKCKNIKDNSGVITSNIVATNLNGVVKIVILTTDKIYKKIRVIAKDSEIIYIINNLEKTN